jgi:pyruvate dehydrogenase E1 component alpha subunit
LQKEVYDGAIDYIQVMDENGNVDAALFPKDINDQKIIDMYKMMTFARALDTKMLSLQRQGRTATYGPLVGEEATQIGAAFAMSDNDYFVPNFRQHGVFLARGTPVRDIVLGWKGYEEGNMMPKGGHALPVSVPVATQMPHAAGLAFAQKYRDTGAAVVSFVGDGGTSEGDFYETLNFAGVFKVPLVAIIENNQWAISVPRSKQSAAQTLAQKGIAAGIPCVQVDGNDVIGVYKAVKDALANSKKGPTLIECITYRMSMHTTADDPTKYRPDSEVEAWKPKDPILRVRRYLTAKGLWSDDKEAALAEEQLKIIDEGVEEAEKFVPDPKSIFQHVYSFIPETLQEEMDAAVAANFWQDEKKGDGE